MKLIERRIASRRVMVLIISRWHRPLRYVNVALLWLSHRLSRHREFAILDHDFARRSGWL